MKPTEAQTQPAGPGSSSVDAAVQQPMLFVQSLKGAPASVLLALAIAGRFMSHQELQLWTRCGKDQVTFALKTLTHLGWAVGQTVRGPWALARPLAVTPPGLPVTANPLKGLSSSSDSLNSTHKEEVLQASPSRKELLDSMYAAGIREPTASELAQLPHMTLEYLQAHVEGARLHGLQIGAAIQAMRLQAPPPARPLTTNRQARTEEQMRRFMEGG
jgi:hypothetical protein